MKLLKESWLPIFKQIRELEKQLDPQGRRKITKLEAGMEADYRAAEALLSISETIVLPSSVMMDLIHNIDRIDTRGWIHLPYPYVTIQFTHPIPEKDIMAHVEMNDLQLRNKLLVDRVQGIIIGNADQDQRPLPPQHVFNMMNCCFLYESTSVNRVAWKGSEEKAELYWEVASFKPHEIPKPQWDNKLRMISLCYAINLFLNAPNVVIHKEKPDPKVQRKREKKGKAVLPEYHTVTIQKFQTVYEEPNRGKGTQHGRMYPVRGHFRKLKQFEDPIWIPNHFRGVQWGEDSMKKEVYRVSPKQNPPDGIDS
jgi:hypothetical protein